MASAAGVRTAGPARRRPSACHLGRPQARAGVPRLDAGSPAHTALAELVGQGCGCEPWPTSSPPPSTSSGARFNEILAEAADYSRLVQTQESQQISGALGVLTVLGLPLGTALGILQVLGDDSLSHLLIALALSVAATAGVLTTRYGRLVLSSLRGGDGRQ